MVFDNDGIDNGDSYPPSSVPPAPPKQPPTQSNPAYREYLQYAKKGTGAIYPERAIATANAPDRIEPILTPKVLKERYFFGIPLASPIDPASKMTAKMLQDYIKRGMNQFERDAQVDVAPVIRSHRLPFDPNLYHQFIYCEIPNKPVYKLLELSIRSASYQDTQEEQDRYPQGAQIYRLPGEWIEMGNAIRGIINVNPINPAFSAVGVTTSVAASGATILQFIGQQGWVPAYWTAVCQHGFCSEEGNVPVIVNECIGLRAAMLILDNLIPLYKVASQSLNIDGLGQSVNDLSYQLLKQKRDQCAIDYKENVKKIKTLTANNFYSGNV